MLALGYYIYSRLHGKYIIFAKAPERGNIDLKKDLSVAQEIELVRRCDNIVSGFEEPYNHVIPIRLRLHNMAQGLKLLAEREFVREFVEEHFPLSSQRKKA